MERHRFLSEVKESTHSLMRYLVLQGVLLIALGVLFAYRPELLLLLISLFVILIGIGALYTAYRIWRFIKHFNSFFELL